MSTLYEILRDPLHNLGGPSEFNDKIRDTYDNSKSKLKNIPKGGFFDHSVRDKLLERLRSEMKLADLEDEFFNIRISFDLDFLWDKIRAMCDCHPGASLAQSCPHIGYSLMCKNCFLIDQFIEEVNLVHVYKEKLRHLTPLSDYIKSIIPSKEWLKKINKLHDKDFDFRMKTWISADQEKGEFFELKLYREKLYLQERDEKYSDVSNKVGDIICGMGCCDSVCSACHCEVDAAVCLGYRADDQAFGGYGSRIMDNDHVHVIKKDELPEWWIKGKAVCDWCIYSLMKKGIVSMNIEGACDPSRCEHLN